MKKLYQRGLSGGLGCCIVGVFFISRKILRLCILIIHRQDAATVVWSESWLWCCSLGIPPLLKVAGGTITSAAMNTLPFEGCTTSRGALSQLFFLMECVSYVFQNKKVCQKIRNFQEFPLRNVFLSVVSGLGFFSSNTFTKHFFMSFSRGALKQKQSSLVKSPSLPFRNQVYIRRNFLFPLSFIRGTVINQFFKNATF